MRSLLLVLLIVCACSGAGNVVPPGDDDDPDGAVTPAVDASVADAMIDDALPGDPDAGGPDAMPPPVDDPAHLFDLQLPGVHHFDISMDPADWQWLKTHALLEQYKPCTITFEGRTWSNVAIRFKGDFGTLYSCFDDAGNQVCPKLSIKLKFNEYDNDGRFYSMRRLNFNSSVRDQSEMREVITYSLFRGMGLPAPRASHATLSVNGDPQGLFVMVEDLDKEYIQDHWTMDEGNLYKAVWPQWTDADMYRSALDTNEGATTDVSRMLQLQQAIAQSTDATFPANVAGKIDLQHLARYLAVDRATRNIDSIRTFRCFDDTQTAEDCINGNYYWYEVPNGPTELLVWDVDLSLQIWDSDLGRSYWDPDPYDCQPTPYCVYFGQSDCVPEETNVWILAPQCNTFYGLLHRATWGNYLDALDELAHGPMALATLLPKMNMVRTRIGPSVMTDPYGPTYDDWQHANHWVDQVLDHQLDEIDILLAEQQQ
ncbi:MAG TPA: CotH kinase family protein [Kofleriaceae bacterium]|nr:CotH kinase family protein [Kofleriaceae bacterium]